MNFYHFRQHFIEYYDEFTTGAESNGEEQRYDGVHS